MSSTEELVGLVLAALHPRLRERCTESKILAVLEELSWELLRGGAVGRFPSTGIYSHDGS